MLNIKTIGAAVVGAAAIGLSVGSVQPAQAITFLNQAVQVDFLSPDTNTLEESLGTKVIDADGELFTSNPNGINALVTSTNILITNLTTGTFTSLPFNGFRFSDANGTIDSIIGVSLVSTFTGGFDPNRVTFNADQIFVNLQDLSPNVGENISLDVQFAAAPIPTPALLPGLIGMGIAAMSKKRKSEQSEQVTETADV